MLEVIDIHTYYGKSYIVKGVSLEVRECSVIGILGRNGAGKTTIIRSIVGFTYPSLGRIIFKQKDVTKLKSYKITQMGLALVPQGRRIFPSLTVKENLTVSRRRTRHFKRWTLERIYNLFPILKERVGLKGNLLSGGEQQMLCIGRALITNPDLMLMDEPSEGLAPLIIREIGSIIKQLRDDNISILLVEQNLPLALEVAEYIYIIDKGTNVYQNTSDQLRKEENTMNKYLGVSV